MTKPRLVKVRALFYVLQHAIQRGCAYFDTPSTGISHKRGATLPCVAPHLWLYFDWILLDVAAGTHAVLDFFPEIFVDNMNDVKYHQAIGRTEIHLDGAWQTRFVEI